ncbi:MAG: DUF262 domain-containing protein [Moraxellaceae bacterium]|nr:DUF262 domain-containing protein [Moraxellaceae bacterium]
MNFTDRIKPTDKGITTYLDDLKRQDYQIPTFQRNVVWEAENVKKLWDSIYKFYPLGSILVWKTDLKLQNHREIGGHIIIDSNFSRNEYQYLLDGQQRTTSLLTSLYGGTIEGKENFDPTLYIDITVSNTDETDDETYKKRFLYWHEINDKQGSFKKNIARQKKFNEGLIIKLFDIKENFYEIQKNLNEHHTVNGQFSHPYMQELLRIKQVLDNYRLSFIELKGIQVAEVCQIFERINQAGKPLDIFDIVVAKTFRPQTSEIHSFYLRELIDDFRKVNNSKFLEISNFDYLQIIAIIISQNIENSGIKNITPRYLNDITTEQIEQVWEDAKKAILKTFDFFENTLNIKEPQLVPYRYFYLTIANYFYKNSNPNYDFLKKYFWFNSLHKDDLLSNTTDIKTHITLLNQEKNKESYEFERFLIDKNDLRYASYSSKGRLSRAILSLYVNHQPKDWKYTDRNVVSEQYFFSTDKPNLHHIFPTSFIEKNKHIKGLNSNSLMNIAYLTQITNLEISDKNPLHYIGDYDKNPDFPTVIKSHLIPNQILDWSKLDEMQENMLEKFIEDRIDIIISELQNKLIDIKFEIIDTKETTKESKI